jgi:hypothetical protein
MKSIKILSGEPSKAGAVDNKASSFEELTTLHLDSPTNSHKKHKSLCFLIEKLKYFSTIGSYIFDLYGGERTT